MGSGRLNCNRRAGVLPAIARRLACTALPLVLVAGCSIAAITRPEHYSVKRGDTLYSIAQRYELDWQEVARWNNIPAPYTLTPGQVLSLERYPTLPYPQPGQADNQQAGKSRPEPVVKKAPKPPVKAKASKPAPRPQPPLAVDDSKHWRWPARGAVLRTYEQTRPRHGIDIGGSPGAPVVAAEAGRVVYSGSGLKGYGKLVIIKHDERFLTAYGFNRKLLVDQGDQVKAGQQIAEMGIGPRNQTMLHFELRQDGEPVDPQRVLPRR